MKIRITADIDTRNPLVALKYFIRAFRIPQSKLIVKLSNTKGFHIIVFTEKTYTQKQIMKLREFIGDDKKRLAIDKKRKHPKQYLFFKKIKLK